TSMLRLTVAVIMIGTSLATFGRNQDRADIGHRPTHGSRAAAPISVSNQATVTISWMPPDTNTDGSALTDLTGYHIHYGTDPRSLVTEIDLPTSGLTDYVVENLDSNTTYYFTVSAYNSAGVESIDSAVVSATTQ